MGDRTATGARALRAGRLVVYPTDTLLGLGARATDRRAVARLVAAKQRPPGAPLSIAVSSTEEVEPWATMDTVTRARTRRLLPGPVTLLLRASPRARRELAPSLIGPRGTIGVRVPDHSVARELARRAGPVVATSANRHGEVPAASVHVARRVFGRAVAVYLAGGPRPSGHPSSLVDLTGRSPRIAIR